MQAIEWIGFAALALQGGLLTWWAWRLYLSGGWR